MYLYVLYQLRLKKQAGYNIITIPPVVRNDYIFGLQEAQLKNNIQPFTNFISEMVLEAQKE